MTYLTKEELSSSMLVVESYAKMKALRIWVFGSYAKGIATTSSDMDILLESDDLSLEGVLDVTIDLKRLTGLDLDILLSRYTEPELLRYIKSMGVLFQ